MGLGVEILYFFQDGVSLFIFRLIKFYDNVIIILSLILLIVTISILSIFSAFPSLEVLYIIEDNYSLSLAIKRIGHQWYWSYEYRDFKDLEFDSYIVTRDFRLLETDNSVVLPVKSHICS